MNSYIKILKTIYFDILKVVPISGIFSIINYLIEGIFPAITAFVLVKLFDGSQLYFWGIILIACYFFQLTIQIIASVLINGKVYEECSAFYRKKLAAKNARLPLIALEDNAVLNLQHHAAKCVDNELLAQIFMSTIVIITNFIGIISLVVVLARYHISFVLIAIFTVVPFLIIRIIRGKEFYSLKKIQLKDQMNLDYKWSLFENKSAIKEMRVLGFTDYLVNKWKTLKERTDKIKWNFLIRDSFLLFSCDLFKIIGFVLAFGLVIYLVYREDISVGVLASFSAVFKTMQDSAKSLFIDIGNLPEKFLTAIDYFKFLELPEEKNGSKELRDFSEIVLKNVSFRYSGASRMTLSNIDLSIKKGETLVILGENGSGKTTLIKLLLGLYQPLSGEIFLDKTNANEFSKESLHSNLSAVMQSFNCYEFSVRENIALSSSFDDGLIQKLLKDLQIDIKIDASLGKSFGGIDLSGGTWQKLAIARGLYHKNELLILDEPTSSLDPIIETEILQQFLNIAAKKTTIIITHRVGICKLASKIIVLENGTIKEIGRHEELLNRKGKYYELYTSQSMWYA